MKKILSFYLTKCSIIVCLISCILVVIGASHSMRTGLGMTYLYASGFVLLPTVLCAIILGAIEWIKEGYSFIDLTMNKWNCG